MDRKPKVVVLDDDQDDRDLILQIYESEACKDIDLTIYSKAEELFSHLRNELPDLLILDQNMPGLSGLEILARLRKNSDYEFLSIILFSTMVDDILCRSAFELGVNGIYQKPVYYKDFSEVFLCILHYAEGCNQGVRYFPGLKEV